MLTKLKTNRQNSQKVVERNISNPTQKAKNAEKQFKPNSKNQSNFQKLFPQNLKQN